MLFWFGYFYFNTFNLFALLQFFFFFLLSHSHDCPLAHSLIHPSLMPLRRVYFLYAVMFFQLGFVWRSERIRIKIHTVELKIINKRHALLRPPMNIFWTIFRFYFPASFPIVCAHCDLFGIFKLICFSIGFYIGIRRWFLFCVSFVQSIVVSYGFGRHDTITKSIEN